MNFDDYIQQLLGNRNPQGNMLTGVSTAPNFYNQAQNNDYYNNPFRRQDSIDAGMAKKLADEQALAQQLGLSNAGGMMSGGGNGGGGGGGGGDYEMSLTPDQIAYFDAETDMERGIRNNNFFNGAAAPIAGLLGGPIAYELAGLIPNNAPVYSGRDDYSTRSPAAIRQDMQLQQSLVADEQRKREAAQVAMAAEQAAAQRLATEQAAAQRLAAAQAAAQVSVSDSGWDGGLSTDYTSSSNDNSGAYGSVDGGRGGWSGGYGGVW